MPLSSALGAGARHELANTAAMRRQLSVMFGTWVERRAPHTLRRVAIGYARWHNLFHEIHQSEKGDAAREILDARRASAARAPRGSLDHARHLPGRDRQVAARPT